MAIIQSYNSPNQLIVEPQGQARVMLYGPDGEPLVSFLRGPGADLDSNSGATDVRDVLAIGVPGPGGARVAGTAATPLVVTGSVGVEFPALQVVSGSVAVSNLPEVQAVAGTVAVSNQPSSLQVSNFPATQQVAGSVSVSNLPATQPVSGTVAVSNHPASTAVSNFPASQAVTGTLGADLRVGGSAVAAGNRVPVDATGTVAVSNLPATQTVAGTVAVSNQPSSLQVSNFPATQTVAGTVAVSNQPTTLAVSNFPANHGADLRVGGSAVAAGNRVPVDATGTVAVSNLPATQQVAGTVAVSNQPTALQVSNFPTTQQVAGSVSVSNQPSSLQVSNFPATQQVAGSVSVSNLPGTQQVAGSVSVSNFPASQPVTGTVAAGLQVNGAGVANSNPVPISVVEPTAAALEFTATIDVAPAAALTDGAVLWCLRNSGTKTIGVRRFDLQQGFFGTAAASRSAYTLQRFTGTITGGTAVNPARKVSSSAASTASVLQGTAALVVTSATFDAGAIHRQASANQLAATSTQDVTFTGGPVLLAPNEGIAVRASGAVLAGSFLTGSLGWYEL